MAAGSAAAAAGSAAAAVAPPPLPSLRRAVRELENFAGVWAASAEAEARMRGELTSLRTLIAGTASDGHSGSGSGSDAAGSGHTSDACSSDGLSDDGYGPGGRRANERASNGNRGGGGCTDDLLASASDADGGCSDDGGSSDGDGGGAAGTGEEVGFRGGDDGGSGGESYGAWHVVLEGLSLTDIDAVQLVQAKFQVSCGRCRAAGTLSIASDAVAGGGRPFEAGGECGTCHSVWTACARPRFVTADAATLCALKLSGCSPMDLLPALLAVQCGGCGGVTTMRGVQVGLPAERACPSCHRRVALRVAAVSFVPRGPPAGGAALTRPPRARGQRGPAGGGPGGGGGVTPSLGSPLPSLGTCRHYRHSYRWLRFPCCGQRFPCDLCHEEAADHEAKWASRMVCGFCSLEQRVESACTGCGKKLASTGRNPSGRSTRYWEGGAGCTDTRFMTRKVDAHFCVENGDVHDVCVG
uniref:CHY-type domain-containing protein n=1 Tax=Chlamydomonas euryale TaxID=1486919 RepID=A0A7R9Z319_9CHLO